MPKRASPANAETVFVKRDGTTTTIRLNDDATRAVCKAAKDLNARYFVALDGWSLVEGNPIWGVFDMDRAQQNNPVPGEWSTDDPIRTFPIDALDAAVVYAVMMVSRR